MRNYDKTEIDTMFNETIAMPANFYDQHFVKYSSLMKGTDIPCSEYIAERLLANTSWKLELKKVIRETSYRTATHQDLLRNGYPCSTSNRVEEWGAKQLFWLSNKGRPGFERIGQAIDYQTPLKNAMKDGHIGKIDLLFHDKGSRCLRIAELKKCGSNETLLRCVLEAYTYSRIVDQEKLIKDFGESDVATDATVEPCVLVFEGGLQHQQTKYSHVMELMRKLEVKLFILNKCWDTSSPTEPAGINIREVNF